MFGGLAGVGGSGMNVIPELVGAALYQEKEYGKVPPVIVVVIPPVEPTPQLVPAAIELIEMAGKLGLATATETG